MLPGFVWLPQLVCAFPRLIAVDSNAMQPTAERKREKGRREGERERDTPIHQRERDTEIERKRNTPTPHKKTERRKRERERKTERESQKNYYLASPHALFTICAWVCGWAKSLLSIDKSKFLTILF
jgi:hypothetical protein